MAERPCPMCGETTSIDARYCSACGVDLLAQVILDPVATPETPESGEERRSLSTLLVPLGVVAVIGLAVVFLVSGGEDEPEPDAAEDVVEAPTATPIRANSPERTPIQPTPTRTGSEPRPAGVDPVDLSPLPPTDATHLAVAHDRDVAFLDLATGSWIVHERVSLSAVPAVNSVIPFADGVVTFNGNAIFHIPLDSRPTVIGQGQPLGVVDGLFWARIWRNDGGPQVIGFDERGQQARRFEGSPRSRVLGVLDSGAFLVEADGKLFTRVGDQTVDIATGSFGGRSEGRILVISCPDSLESCRHTLTEVETDARVDVEVPVRTDQSMRLAPDGRILVWNTSDPSATAYTLDDEGRVVAEEDLLDQQASLIEMGIGGPAIATDATGLYARVEGDRLLFHGPTGEPITEVALDFLPGFGDSYALAFIGSDG